MGTVAGLWETEEDGINLESAGVQKANNDPKCVCKESEKLGGCPYAAKKAAIRPQTRKRIADMAATAGLD